VSGVFCVAGVPIFANNRYAGSRYAGELAVPCNPQSAIAGANSLAEAVSVRCRGGRCGDEGCAPGDGAP